MRGTRNLYLPLLAALLLATACTRQSAPPPAGPQATAGSHDTTAPPPTPIAPPVTTPPPVTPAPGPANPTESVVAIYKLTDLLAGRKEPATTWRVPEPVNGFTLAPGGETALLFAQDPMIPGPAPHLLHLPTGKVTPLPGPARDDWFPLGGWLPDGRLILAGKDVWVGGRAGEGLRSVAKPGLVWVAKPSAPGRHLALWNPGGQIQILDLGSGQIDTLTRPFRRPAADGAVAIAWSPDGEVLAGSDYDREDGRSVRIRLIDAQSRQQVREIDGLGLSAWLPDGNLLAFRPGEGGGAEHLLITPGGKTLREFKGDLSPVPGGRYLLEMVYKGPETSAFLVEIATGERKPIPLPAYPRGWTPGGDPILITEKK